MRGAEQHVPGAGLGYPVLDPVMPFARRHEIDFVALMRNLRAICRTRGKRISRSPSTNTSAERPGVRGRASAAARDTGRGVRSI